MMMLLERLKLVGVETEHSLERFAGNKALYTKFLRKFLNDPNLAALKEALDLNQYDNAQICAHTLKGVSANLGMDELSQTCHTIVLMLRNNQQDKEKLQELFQKLSEQYDRIVAEIQIED